MFFRTLLQMFRSRRSRRTSPIGIHDVGRIGFRVLPTDLDVLGHLNNGVYFSLMDLGRLDLMIRSGAWPKLQERGYYPVMGNETITFRKSLMPRQQYVLESRIVGYDDRAVYVEQRFVVEGEIYASAMTRGRFLKKSGGVVSISEISEVVGVDATTLRPPAWVEQWAQSVTLPPTREAAPSTW